MRIVGYIRVSDKEQVKKGFSIPAQEEAILEWAEENKHDVVRVFTGPGRSGTKSSRKTRPTFEHAVNLVLAGVADGLVVKWMDRFARNVEDFLRVRSLFYQAGKYLISISEPLLNGDPADPVARYISVAIMNAYQLQAELSGLKAAQGRERRARQGNYPGSLPIGYQRTEDKRTIPDPDYWPLIAQSFADFASGRYTLDTWTIEAKQREKRHGNCTQLVCGDMGERGFGLLRQQDGDTITATYAVSSKQVGSAIGQSAQIMETVAAYIAVTCLVYQSLFVAIVGPLVTNVDADVVMIRNIP